MNWSSNEELDYKVWVALGGAPDIREYGVRAPKFSTSPEACFGKDGPWQEALGLGWEWDVTAVDGSHEVAAYYPCTCEQDCEPSGDRDMEHADYPSFTEAVCVAFVRAWADING